MENQSNTMELYDLEFGSFKADANMALDAWMLDQAYARNAIIFRFYRWTEPAITFGYSQKWAFILSQNSSFSKKAIRRVTGGGIVDHQNDLTYALAIPYSHPEQRQDASIVYEKLHKLIADTLSEGGIDSVQTPCERGCSKDSVGKKQTAAGVCFDQSEVFDVVDATGHEKIAGAAMKRNRSGMLIQGSILVPSGWKSILQTMASFPLKISDWLGAEHKKESLPPTRSFQNYTNKFSSREWNEKR